MLQDLTRHLGKLWSSDRVDQAVHALVIVVLGLILARVASRGVAKLVARRDAAHARTVRRVVAWSVVAVTAAWALEELGFKIGVLLGAAGVVTVAIGFAAQSSLSNLISGLFLFAERPFSIGDVVELEGVTGEVLAVELLSTKLRTFDNHYVRIPNEVIFKTKVVNLTRFPLRRVDLLLPVAYQTDVAALRGTVLAVASANDKCLAEPAPLLFISSFDESRILMQLSVWCATPDFLALKTSIQEQVKAALDAAGVRPPLPQRVLIDERPGHG